MTHVSLSFFHFTVQRLCRHEGLLRHDGQGPAQSHDPRWILHFRHRLDRQNVQTLAHPRGKKTSSLSITFQSARSAPARPLLHLLLLPPDSSVVGRRSFSLILPSIICFCFVCRSNCFFLLFLSVRLATAVVRRHAPNVHAQELPEFLPDCAQRERLQRAARQAAPGLQLDPRWHPVPERA